MRELLSVATGGDEAFKRKPRAVFDVCPTPPLQWSDNTSSNIIEGARNFIPMELVAVPLSGAAAPITLIGSVVQHVAENFSGLTLHQCAQPGAPIVFGGAPSIFDMRMGVTPLGRARKFDDVMRDGAGGQDISACPRTAISVCPTQKRPTCRRVGKRA